MLRSQLINALRSRISPDKTPLPSPWKSHPEEITRLLQLRDTLKQDARGVEAQSTQVESEIMQEHIRHVRERKPRDGRAACRSRDHARLGFKSGNANSGPQPRGRNNALQSWRTMMADGCTWQSGTRSRVKILLAV
jgi:hypothetical protein